MFISVLRITLVYIAHFDKTLQYKRKQKTPALTITMWIIDDRGRICSGNFLVYYFITATY